MFIPFRMITSFLFLLFYIFYQKPDLYCSLAARYLSPLQKSSRLGPADINLAPAAF